MSFTRFSTPKPRLKSQTASAKAPNRWYDRHSRTADCSRARVREKFGPHFVPCASAPGRPAPRLAAPPPAPPHISRRRPPALQPPPGGTRGAPEGAPPSPPGHRPAAATTVPASRFQLRVTPALTSAPTCQPQPGLPRQRHTCVTKRVLGAQQVHRGAVARSLDQQHVRQCPRRTWLSVVSAGRLVVPIARAVVQLLRAGHSSHRRCMPRCAGPTLSATMPQLLPVHPRQQWDKGESAYLDHESGPWTKSGMT